MQIVSRPSRCFRLPSFILHRLCLGLILVLSACGAALLPQPAAAQALDNGIVVGPAKLYDQRSLETLLDSVSAGLAGTSFINGGTVAANEGMIQGGSSTSSSLSLGVLQQPLAISGGSSSAGKPPAPSAGGVAAAPAVSMIPPASGGGAAPAAAGGPAPAAQAHAPAGTGGPSGAPPAAAPTLALPATTTSNAVGISAPLAVNPQDLLQQQVGLSFDAINLQLLLSHALSDRLIFQSDSGAAVPRALAVLGFQISVVPTGEDKFAVAEADITVSSPDGEVHPQVAMMLPQDKTYNVSKVTSDSRTISLGAFATPFTGSLNGSSSHQGAFVVYDVDTVAIQKPPTDNSSVTFGWQFRPVLGQHSVQPGTRQVYVLLSLPVTSDQSYTPKISVQTYWKKLDTKSGTVDPHQMARTSSYVLDPLSIHKINDYDDGLRPVVDDIESNDQGNGNVYIEAIGSNFTQNMAVSGPGVASDVHEQGGRLISFNVPLTALQYENPSLIGAYGLPVELVQTHLRDANGEIVPGTPGEGIAIRQVSVVHFNTDESVVKITLAALHPGADGSDVKPRLPSNGQLVITVGGQVFGLNDNPVAIENDPDQTTTTTLEVRVPNAALSEAQKVTIRYVFCGDDYRADYALPRSAFTADTVSVVSKNQKSVVLAISGDLHKSIKAYINGVEFDPTISQDGAFLLLQAKASRPDHEPHRGPPPSRGVNPFAMPAMPESPEPSYNLALLTAQRSQLDGAGYIVLYEPNAPAQLLSLSGAQTAMNPPAAHTVSTATASSSSMPSQLFLWGTWLNPGVTAPASLQSGVAAPGTNGASAASTPPVAQQSPPIILQMNTGTVTKTGGTVSAPPKRKGKR